MAAAEDMNLLARVGISEVGPRANSAFPLTRPTYVPCWAMMAAMKPGLLRPLKEKEKKSTTKEKKKKENIINIIYNNII